MKIPPVDRPYRANINLKKPAAILPNPVNEDSIKCLQEENREHAIDEVV